MPRIVGWNIRAGGGKRVHQLLRAIGRWKPDVVVLSEFRGTPPSHALARSLRRRGLGHQLTTATNDKPARNALLLASRYPMELKDGPSVEDLSLIHI